MVRETESRNTKQPLAAAVSPPVLIAGALLLAGCLGMGYLGVSLRPHKPEVVFVKTGDVMSRFKLGIKARETFQKETSAWEEESKQLEGKMRELAKTAKPTDEKAMEQARQLRSRMQTLRDKGAQRDQELMAPVIAEINSGIKKFAQKNGYKLVLGTLQGGVVLHGEDAVDVTEALITEMNK